mgnify:FL=1
MKGGKPFYSIWREKGAAIFFRHFYICIIGVYVLFINFAISLESSSIVSKEIFNYIVRSVYDIILVKEIANFKRDTRIIGNKTLMLAVYLQIYSWAWAVVLLFVFRVFGDTS